MTPLDIVFTTAGITASVTVGLVVVICATIRALAAWHRHGSGDRPHVHLGEVHGRDSYGFHHHEEA